MELSSELEIGERKKGVPKTTKEGMKPIPSLETIITSGALLPKERSSREGKVILHAARFGLEKETHKRQYK